ncbi:MAG TPA: S1C family serine protease [Geminicoccaceae bacterium]|nr:S1C family serine protease [Geminicoccaceae bacterium]
MKTSFGRLLSLRRRAPRAAALLGTLLPLLCGPGAVAAETAAPADRLAAVVHVRAEIPRDARTADTLGTEREGSGVVIDTNGLVLTIGYVILEAMAVDVVGSDGTRVPASVVAYDHESGFGLLRATADLGVEPMPLGDSGAIEPIRPALVVSNTGELSVQAVYVVDRREFAGYWEYLLDGALFTAPPHRDFAGAALVGPDGRLLGVGSLFVGDALGGSRRRQLVGNMFVPVDALKPILADLLADGRRGDPPRPWLGLTLREIQGGRVHVTRVVPDGPAARAGMEAGDTIVGVGGDEVRGLADFYRKVWSRGEAGASVPLNLLRGVTTAETVVESGDRYRWLRLRPSY